MTIRAHWGDVRKFPFVLLTASLLLTWAGCRTAPSPEERTRLVQTSKIADAPATNDARPLDPNTAHVAVIGLSDFHGWLSPLEPKGFQKSYGGIARVAAFLEHKEKLDPNTSLIVDNGDAWTGPTESTLLMGAPVIEAYNELGVVAANLGNHEFDFGMDVLAKRAAEAKFPFVSANVFLGASNERPAFIKRYLIAERDGVKIGIVGLAFLDTPRTTRKMHVEGIRFADYAETLSSAVPEMKQQGAQVVAVLFHDTLDVIEKTLERVNAVPIDLVIAGQDHRKGARNVGRIPVVNPGPFGRSYVRFNVEVDRATGRATSVTHETVDVEATIGDSPFSPAPRMLQIVEHARQATLSQASEVVGHLAVPLGVGTMVDSPLGHFVTDSWLSAVPNADFAMLNHGAIRQPLASGPVTWGNIVSVLPFENNLFVVKVTGGQLRHELAIDSPVVSGLTWTFRIEPEGRKVVAIMDRSGRPIDDNTTYRIVINDFMLMGGDGFRFQADDPAPEDTGLSMREPVLRTLRAAARGGRAISPVPGARAKELAAGE